MNETNETNRITHDLQGRPLSPSASDAVNEMAGNLEEEQEGSADNEANEQETA